MSEGTMVRNHEPGCPARCDDESDEVLHDYASCACGHSKRQALEGQPERWLTRNTTILVWSWFDAPEEFRALSTLGGDEDYVALVPEGYRQYAGWLDEGGPFGCCSVERHELGDGAVVYIGAHS
jgi:hypothetical protein